MAIEFARRKQNIAVVMLHPGTVDTDLSEPFQKVRPQLHCTCRMLHPVSPRAWTFAWMGSGTVTWQARHEHRQQYVLAAVSEEKDEAQTPGCRM